jgi:septum formation protein
MMVSHMVLASTSVFRKRVLDERGIKVLTAEPNCQESLIDDPNPRTVARLRSELKAGSIDLPAGITGPCLVIGADQTLSCDGRRLTKAKNRDEAVANIKMLAGKQHFLHSGLALAIQDGAHKRIVYSDVVDISMTMRSLTDEQIKAYVERGEWEGCVGSYRFEESGGLLFQQVDGEQSAILGMPISALILALGKLNVDLLDRPLGPWFLAADVCGTCPKNAP